MCVPVWMVNACEGDEEREKEKKIEPFHKCQGKVKNYSLCA